MIVFSSLLQQLLGAAAAGGQVLEQLRNEERQDGYETEGKNKDHWGLVALMAWEMLTSDVDGES